MWGLFAALLSGVVTFLGPLQKGESYKHAYYRLSSAITRFQEALRLAAAALRSSQSALGAYFRRMCSRMDKPKAVTAAAHKLARLIYTMLTKGEEYTAQGQEYYEERYRERVLRHLAQRAEKMGMKLVASEIRA